VSSQIEYANASADAGSELTLIIVIEPFSRYESDPGISSSENHKIVIASLSGLCRYGKTRKLVCDIKIPLNIKVKIQMQKNSRLKYRNIVNILFTIYLNFMFIPLSISVKAIYYILYGKSKKVIC